MQKKNIFAFSIFTVVTVLGVLFLWHKSKIDQVSLQNTNTTIDQRSADEKQMSIAAEVSRQSVAQFEREKEAILQQPRGEWQTYENTAYFYKMKFPQSNLVSLVQEMERVPIEQSREIVGSHPGGKGAVKVTAWDPAVFKVTDEASAEFHKYILSDLKSFAETARQKEINDKNPNFPNKKIGELQEVTFANQKALRYVVTGSMDGYGYGDDYYLFTEYKNVKYKISYPVEDKLSQAIIDTFEFVK